MLRSSYGDWLANFAASSDDCRRELIQYLFNISGAALFTNALDPIHPDEQQSKLLVSPLMSPIVFTYMIPCSPLEGIWTIAQLTRSLCELVTEIPGSQFQSEGPLS